MDGDCIQKDDGNEVLGKLLNADAVVFATPVYYFGMSAQLYPRAKRFSRFIGARRGHIRAITLANHNACEYKNDD